MNKMPIKLKATMVDSLGNKLIKQSVFKRSDPLYPAIEKLREDNYKLLNLEVIKL